MSAVEIPTPFARAAAATDPMSETKINGTAEGSKTSEPLPQDNSIEAVRDTSPPIYIPFLTSSSQDSSDYETFPDDQSETTSVASAIYRGYVENGRRYATGTTSQNWLPSDQQQFECLEAGHICFKILDCQEENDLFRAPIGDSPKNILDLGTGDGSW